MKRYVYLMLMLYIHHSPAFKLRDVPYEYTVLAAKKKYKRQMI